MKKIVTTFTLAAILSTPAIAFDGRPVPYASANVKSFDDATGGGVTFGLEKPLNEDISILGEIGFGSASTSQTVETPYFPMTIDMDIQTFDFNLGLSHKLPYNLELVGKIGKGVNTIKSTVQNNGFSTSIKGDTKSYSVGVNYEVNPHVSVGVATGNVYGDFNGAALDQDFLEANIKYKF